jgi:hypothetical protein
VAGEEGESYHYCLCICRMRSSFYSIRYYGCSGRYDMRNKIAILPAIWARDPRKAVWMV